MHTLTAPPFILLIFLSIAQGFDIRLQIDGGVTVDNIKEVAEAGVDMFVAGSAILKAPRTQDAYR